MRTCEKCGMPMAKGFVIGDGESYYCSEGCLYQDMTEQEYEELYENDEAYWTMWEEEAAGYFETGKIVTSFLCENFTFWLREGKTQEQAIELAIKDADGIATDPFSPNGKLLDEEAARATVGFWKEYMMELVSSEVTKGA